MAVKYNIAVFMPSGENRFYLDEPGMGQAYGTYVGKELPHYLRRTFHLSNNREDTYIGGLSMNGSYDIGCNIGGQAIKMVYK